MVNNVWSYEKFGVLHGIKEETPKQKEFPNFDTNKLIFAKPSLETAFNEYYVFKLPEILR